MKKMKFVSVTLSIALISALGLGGCGGNSQEPTTVTEQSKVSGEKKQGYNAVSGKVILNERPNSIKSRSLTKNQAKITAYNLNDNTNYKTTTDASGKYELSGLSDGDYQIFAQNDQYAKNAVQRVTLKKGTRQVVDFTLTASGSVSGKISGAGTVYIPGTDHVSIADETGNFSLTGIPVGTYVLVYEDDYSSRKKRMEIEVTAGGITPIDIDSGFSQNNYYDDFAYVNTSLENGVLGFNNDGIAFNIYNINNMNAKYPDFKSYITLKNSAGEVIPIEVDYRIKTKEIVPSGEYTLTFKKEISEILNSPIDTDRVYTFNVELVSIVFADAEEGSRFIQVNLPSILTQAQKDSLANLKIVEKGTSEALILKQVWEENQTLTLFGSFKTGVEYELQPTDEQLTILGSVKAYDDSLIFGLAKIDDIYPDNDTQGIDITQNLYVTLDYARDLDTSTVKFTLNDQNYTGNDISFNGGYQDSTYNMYQSSRTNISFKHDKLEYGTDYTLTFEAKDMSGNTITKSTTFKTLSPSIIDISPDSMEELFYEYKSIEFNIPVDKESGTISIENLTDASNRAEIITEVEASMYDQSRVYFDVSKLAPNQRYKITAFGFKDRDGVDIPEKSTEFATPPKMLFIQDQYSQNMNVSGESFNHKVNLFFFGGLSDDEKTFLEDNLVVTSYGEPVIVDDTHPIRKLFFIEEDSGVTVSVAFTIDPDTNYEVALNSLTGLSDIIFPDNTKLVSFATTRSDNSVNPNAFGMIERLSVSQPNLREVYDTEEPEMKLISDISMNVKIPLGYIELYQDEYGYTQYESCWSKYNDIDYNKVANDLVEESLNVNSAGEAVVLEFNDMGWNISEEWAGNDKQMCVIRSKDYSYQSIASFKADYNKTYEISLDFTDTLQFDGLVSNTLLTQTVKTDPVGTLNFGLYGGMNQDMIMFNINSNAPMKTDNIDELFNVKVNGELFEPDYEFYGNEMNATTHLSFPVPRTLYSLLQLEFSKAADQDLMFINPLTDEEVVNNSSLTEPIVFVEDVAPDLLPVKVEGIKTISMQNNQIEMYFNRAVDFNDIATVGDDGLIETIAFEVKANDDRMVAIVDVDGGYDGVMFTLAEELNASKTYTLSLKTGSSIKAAFGVQELKEFSQEIPLTYIEMSEMVNIVQQGSVSNNRENAYELGSTNWVNATFDNSSAVIIPVNMTEGVAIDVNKSSINVKRMYNFNDILNTEAFIFDSEKMMFVQPIQEEYDIKVDAEIVYTVNTQEYSIDASATPNRVELPYIGSFYGNGADAITFRVENMDYDYEITPENFVVYDEEREIVNANISVQFDMETNNEPTVTFGNLAPDSIYVVEIVGIPNNMPSSMSEMSIDTIFISTPAE